MRVQNLAASVACLAVFAAGCATVEPVPAKRPMSAENAAIAGATEATYVESNLGVGKGWFYTSTASAGAAYGLVGALTTAVIDAIINAGPSSRATRVAEELAGAMPIDGVNSQMLGELREEVQTGGSGAGITLTAVTSDALIGDPLNEAARSGISGRLTILTSYTMSEDASALRVVATAIYNDPATPWRTPYTFTRAVPQDQLTGPAYRNTFIYYSDAIATPELTPAFKERLIAAVEAAARDANGNLPEAGSSEFRSYTRELERARDDTFSKDEIALFLTVEWTKDNGAKLREHISAAHDFIARYVVKDINDPTVPSLTGTDERLETLAGDRTVRRVGSGPEAGSYVSSPGNVSTFVTFGNTVNYSQSSRDRAERLRDAARTQRSTSRRTGN
jgi:hypothetical protein